MVRRKTLSSKLTATGGIVRPQGGGFSECAVLVMPLDEALASSNCGIAEFLYTVDHH
ncbi:MAG: hypothetical protein V7K26_29020 [Nostoc sp.]|uniref:hypothetical protein n=1 Tax=Nostoc sp. TaxID=1180 RepID=UPI002FF9FB79